MKDIKIDTLGYFVDRTFSHMVKFLNYQLAESGLPFQHPQFIILMILSKKDGLPQTVLTEIIDRDKASVSRNIKFLEDLNYIRRDMEGGKKKMIFLTEKGKEIIPKIHEIARLNKETSLRGFSEKYKTIIFDLLEKMYQNLAFSMEI